MLTRLQNAVKNSPRARPQAVVAQQPAAAEQPTEKPRFGINSLIGRMTGHSGEAATAAKPQPSVRRQPPVTAPEEEMELDPEQERIEIPAFLRRQAN